MGLTLDREFEDQLQEALLDEAESALVGQRGGPVFEAVQASHERLRAWAGERDYDVEPIIESFSGIDVDRSGDSLTIRWGYDHPAAKYFEFGTSDHTIQGNPVLSFVWDATEAPRWVKKEFEREGDGYRVFFRSVEVSGVAETRFTRRGLEVLRAELQSP